METFKVFGKLKRKELSLGSTNNVRGMNDREERLLRNSLGSLEKARKKSLFHIQTEVKEIQDNLKETTSVWNGNSDDSKTNSSVSPRCRRIASALEKTRFLNNQNLEEEMCDKLADEEVKETLDKKSNCWIQYSTQITQDQTRDEPSPRPSQVRENRTSGSSNGLQSTQASIFTTRPRNISTGSIPVSLQRQAVEHSLRKPASHSDIYSALKSPGLHRRLTPEHLGFQSIALTQSPRLLRRQHDLKSASVENIRCTSVSPVGEVARILSPSTPRRKITINFGTTSRPTGNSLSLNSSPTSPRRKPILNRVRSQPILSVHQNSSSPVHKGSEKHVSFSESKETLRRKISCPLLSPRSQEKELFSLATVNGSRTLSRMSTELPDVNDPHSGGVQTPSHNEPCLSVSPVNNSSWTLSDRELQNRVNAFLDTLQIADEELESPE